MIILCTVDITTREVTIPSDQRIASYDHKVDVIRFQVETIPGFSLDTSSIKIAAQGPNKARHDYAVDPSTVAIEEETGYITFDWPIPAGVTEMPIGTFKYGDTGQLIFAVCAEIISGSTVSKAWHSDDGVITVVAHLEPESGGGEDPSEEATNAQKIAALQRQVGAISSGAPPTAASTAGMDPDISTTYINTTDGHLYFWNGTDWDQGGIYGANIVDDTVSEAGMAAEAAAVRRMLEDKADKSDVDSLEATVESKADASDVETLESAVSQLETDFNGLEIEGYTKEEWQDVTENAILHTGAYVEVKSNNTINIYSSSTYKYLEYDITDETKIKATGLSFFGIKPAIFADDNGNVLGYAPEERVTTETYTTVTIDVPAGATKLYTSGKNAHTLIIENHTGQKFVIDGGDTEDTVSAVVLTKNGNDIQIRAELTDDTDIAIRGNLTGSANKTFIWSQYHVSISHEQPYNDLSSGTNWKMAADDITPVHFNNSYRGGGHGDDRTKLITCSSAHGLTEANIGEIWTDANNVDWMILKVPSTTTAVVGRPADGTSYAKAFEAGNPASPLTKGGTSVAFASYAQYLLTPCANHVSVDVYVDNKQVSANGVYRGNTVDIVESYDIIYIPAMLSYLADNVGSNTNLSLCDESIDEAYCTVNNVYHYTEHGACTLFQSIDFHKQVKFEYYGGVQSQPIGNYMNVPKSVSWQTITEQPASDRIVDTSEWADIDNPPTRFYQYDAVNWTKGFVLGVNNNIADGLPNVRKNSNNACSYYRTRKVYPYFRTDENPMAEGTVVSAVTYRIPLVPYGDTDIPNVAWYYVNDDIYLLIDVQKSVDKHLALPEKMIGKKIEIVETAGSITLPYAFVGAKGIRIKTTDYGSAILKLT